MGITGFGHWINNIQRARIKEGKLPLSVSSLFVDMNNIFHDAASDIFLYSKKYNKMPIDKKKKIINDLRKKTEEERIFIVATRVIEMIFELVKTIKPKEFNTLFARILPKTACWLGLVLICMLQFWHQPKGYN